MIHSGSRFNLPNRRPAGNVKFFRRLDQVFELMFVVVQRFRSERLPVRIPDDQRLFRATVGPPLRSQLCYLATDVSKQDTPPFTSVSSRTVHGLRNRVDSFHLQPLLCWTFEFSTFLVGLEQNSEDISMRCQINQHSSTFVGNVNEEALSCCQMRQVRNNSPACEEMSSEFFETVFEAWKFSCFCLRFQSFYFVQSSSPG